MRNFAALTLFALASMAALLTHLPPKPPAQAVTASTFKADHPGSDRLFARVHNLRRGALNS